MEEGYLYLEKDDAEQTHYFAYTNSGALYYGAADNQLDLTSEWKLVCIDERTVETIH